ncbi:MAG: 4-alpha-glucanotransferase [Treponema sp.]|nr:4-alpha-glucanotransferase [Candidatus Treponema caballi]
MKYTGTAIPLGALRTKNSCGSGEFPDLIPFADFCKKAGLSVIQLLPVNDTGTESSPYSALSAFALQPLYISITSLPELCAPETADAHTLSASQKKLVSAAKRLRDQWEGEKRYSYRKLRTEKLSLLREVYDTLVAPDVPKALEKWIKAHPWIKEYAVFMTLKNQNFEASWKEWPKYKKITPEKLDELWNAPERKQNLLFYAWLQMRADEQFSEAASYVAEQGIKLKGDIPIMMNEDSHDVWAHPELFNMHLRAGAPVDGPNPVGQNWGFPTYNWKNLKKTGYAWWKDRLVSASRYYKMYRIDHILGFFRIWAIPDTECTAVLGHTEPFEGISREELHELGFTDERIRWLSKPHVLTQLIQDANGGDYLGTHGLLHTLMDRIGEEELWLFKDEIAGDKDIWAREELPFTVREKLIEKWRDRMLVQTGPDEYFPSWTYGNTTAWYSLSDTEKELVQDLFTQKQLKMEFLWEQQARELLGELTGATKMVPCAEDLGAAIDSLPVVLADLKINSLRVVRWSREWAEDGQPFIPFDEYPELSVTTASVHDSSTLRQWWTEEPDSEAFFDAFPPENDDIIYGKYSPETAAYLLETIAQAKSRYVIHPIQDYLGLVDTYDPEKLEDERVNLPGSVNEFNWTYRLPATVEELSKDKKLCAAINRVAKPRSTKKEK